MLTSEIRDFIKTLTSEPTGFSIGKINGDLEKQVGVFETDIKVDFDMAIGGKENSIIKEKMVSILIHWNKNSKDTEVFSNTLLDKLIDVKNATFQDYNINFVNPQYNNPIDLSTDKNGIYERLIMITIYYNKI